MAMLYVHDRVLLTSATYKCNVIFPITQVNVILVRKSKRDMPNLQCRFKIISCRSFLIEGIYNLFKNLKVRNHALFYNKFYSGVGVLARLWFCGLVESFLGFLNHSLSMLRQDDELMTIDR